MEGGREGGREGGQASFLLPRGKVRREASRCRTCGEGSRVGRREGRREGGKEGEGIA
jgi:hypothetical protein